MNKTHNLGSDQLTIALTDTLPTSSNAVLADITQISYTNLSSRNITTSSSSQTGGTYKLILVTPLTLSASGAVAQFRYVVVYNSTASGGPLICWTDFASEVNMINGDSFVITFDATNGLFSFS